MSLSLDNKNGIAEILEYHQRTKHHLDRYAAHLGYMDWESQPDPFRRYSGAEAITLEQIPSGDLPAYDAIFDPARSPVRPVDFGSISQLFFDSFALSAWKRVRERTWAVRCNPSSGNLHPTEAYLLSPPLPGHTDVPALLHYDPHKHRLEKRATLPPLVHSGTLLVGLTTIYWRESWKYGERAFRYCHMDMGHAIGAVAIAAALLGWHTRIVDSVPDAGLARWLGVNDQDGPEAEHAECLLYLYPHDQSPQPLDLHAEPIQWSGKPNRLSLSHHDWPVIEAAGEATVRMCTSSCGPNGTSTPISFDHGAVPARPTIRQRRSALAMDGTSAIDRDPFWLMLRAVMPQHAPFTVLSWLPSVHLALFVHRVDGLPSGLYMLLRNEVDSAPLRSACHDRFLWEPVIGCPDDLPLYLLEESDERDAAKTISCHQDIAADGVFALGMIASFQERLEQSGAHVYKRLHWEAGLIGQVLYLEAEAAGIRSTGIGCYFDDAMHDRLGLEGFAFQSLYHFTVGAAVEDPRLRTDAAYAHLA